jgi:UrcA family protein
MSYNHPTVLLMAAMSVLGAGAAQAEDSEDFRKEVVPIQSFELQTDGGLHAVVMRLQRAAKQVCKEQIGLGYSVNRSCENFAMDTAMRQLQELSASHSSGELKPATSHSTGELKPATSH